MDTTFAQGLNRDEQAEQSRSMLMALGRLFYILTDFAVDNVTAFACQCQNTNHGIT